MSERNVRIHFVHSNDLHSHLEQCSRIAGQIQAIRDQFGADHVFAMDLGDHLDRVCLETEGTDGRVNIDVINQSGFDAIVLGNNEGLTFSASQLEELYGKMNKVPVITANWFDQASGQRPAWMLPHLCIEKAGLRIGVIGLTVNFHEFYELLGWDLQDPILILQEQVRQLRDQLDLLVVASHVGLPGDRRMASEIAGIDLIFGAHTHHRLDPPEKIGQTWLFGTGKYGQALGHVTVEYDLESNQIFDVSSQLIEMNEHTPVNKTILALIERHRLDAQIRMNEIVAALSEPLEVRLDQESALPNLLAKVLREKTGAQFALINSGVCLRDLPKGDVTRADLLHSCPSPINPCVIEVSGQAIFEALELSLEASHVFRSLTGYGFRGKEIGCLAVDGIWIEADSSLPSGQRILRAHDGRNELERNQDYRIATADLFTFGVGYPTLGAGKHREYIVPPLLRDWLLEALHRADWIVDAKRQRWHVRN